MQHLHQKKADMSHCAFYKNVVEIHYNLHLVDVRASYLTNMNVAHAK